MRGGQVQGPRLSFLFAVIAFLRLPIKAGPRVMCRACCSCLVPTSAPPAGCWTLEGCEHDEMGGAKTGQKKKVWRLSESAGDNQYPGGSGPTRYGLRTKQGAHKGHWSHALGAALDLTFRVRLSSRASGWFKNQTMAS